MRAKSDRLRELAVRLHVEQDCQFASSSPVEFRSRIYLRGRLTPGQVRLGYFGLGSRDLVAIEDCPVAHPTIRRWLKEMAPGVAPASDEVPFRLLVQWLPESNRLWLVGFSFAEHQAQMRALLHQWAHHPLVDRATLSRNPSSAVAYERDGQTTFYHQSDMFQQVHHLLSRRLWEEIRYDLETRARRRVLDLYAGNGNLSLGLASDRRAVRMVEQNPHAHLCARKSCQELAAEVCAEAIHDSVERYLLSEQDFAADAVIVDPPRRGLGASLDPIARLNADDLYYVSCMIDCAQEDLTQLRERGYRLRWVKGFDFFPQTPHFEGLFALTREAKTDCSSRLNSV